MSFSYTNSFIRQKLSGDAPSMVIFYISLAMAIGFGIASLVVPYYSKNGISYGIFDTDSIDEECLGTDDEHMCNANKTLPIISIVLGFVVAAASLCSIECMEGVCNSKSRFLPAELQTIIGANITAFAILVLGAVFSIASVGTQFESSFPSDKSGSGSYSGSGSGSGSGSVSGAGSGSGSVSGSGAGSGSGSSAEPPSSSREEFGNEGEEMKEGAYFSIVSMCSWIICLLFSMFALRTDLFPYIPL
jgi:hypothetical protein